MSVAAKTTRKAAPNKQAKGTQAKRRKVAGLDDSPPGAPRLLLTVEESAAALGIGKSAMWTLVARGEHLGGCLSIKVGGSRRVPIWALEEYIRRQAGRDSRSA